jgi:DNA polymerase III subunit delta
MNIKPEQLEVALRKGLQPVYLLCGDEPLQLMESADQIRRVARTQGYAEREVHDVESHFEWADLLGSTRMMSLFSQLRVIELRMGQGKLGEKGDAALLALVEQPPADTLLLLIAGKLEKSAQNSKWYKAIEASGILLQVWPLDAKQLPGWILRRAQSSGVSLRPEAAQLLAEGCEGNLLAAAQEIDKITLAVSRFGHQPAAVARGASGQRPL